MHGFVRLREAMAKNWRFCNVIIYAIYVCVGVVNDIVFLFPNESVRAQCIHGEAHNIIQAFALGVASMTRIVHDIEPNARQEEA